MSDFLIAMGMTRQDFIDGIFGLLPNLISSVSVIFFAVVFYFITAHLMETALRRTAMEVSLVKITVRSIYKWTIIIIAIITFLNQLGINVTAAIAGVGAAGIAVGLAAKETLTNIMSGFGIFIDKLYRRGDWVNVGSHHGEVMDVTLRTTKMRTLDNAFIIVPNGMVTTMPIINYSEEGMLRVTIEVGISYRSSIEEARTAILQAVKSMEGVLPNPAPQVVVDKLDDSCVTLKVRIWIADAGQEPKFRFALTELTKNALDRAGIQIPFPQREVHLIQ
jgi:small conductance mechanosensitive channel